MRKTKVLGFSAAPEIAEEYAQLANRSRKSKSELFRQMVETYKAKLEEEEFLRLQKKMIVGLRRKQSSPKKRLSGHRAVTLELSGS